MRRTRLNYKPGAFNIHCWRCKAKIKSTAATRFNGIWYCPGCVDAPNRLIPGPEDNQLVSTPQQDGDDLFTGPTGSVWEDINANWEMIKVNWEDMDEEEFIYIE